VGEDIVEIIGAVGAQFNGFLEGLGDSVPPVCRGEGLAAKTHH